MKGVSTGNEKSLEKLIGNEHRKPQISNQFHNKFFVGSNLFPYLFTKE
jgi:hypothetical protein